MSSYDYILIGATWCAPCKAVKTFLDNRGISYTYIDIDSDQGMKLAASWGIRAVPAMAMNQTIVTGDKAIMEAFGE